MSSRMGYLSVSRSTTILRTNERGVDVTVDQKSYDLAAHFLEDVKDVSFVKEGPRSLKAKQLAEAIQRAVEDWLCDHVVPF